MVWPEGKIFKRNTSNGVIEWTMPRPRFYVADGSRTSFDVFLTSHRNMGALKPVSVGKSIYGQYEDVEIFFISKRKLRITSSNINTINEIACNETLNEQFCIFIPSEYCEVKGVVPIPEDYSEEEIYGEVICKNLSKYGPVPSSCNVSEVRRFTRVDPKNKGKRYNLDSVQICFTGRVLPSHVNVGGVNFPVSPFRERVTQCGKCWHFGHHEKSCTRLHRLCKTCSGVHDGDVCNNDVRCVNCGGGHLSSSGDCPILLGLKKAKMERANRTRPRITSFVNNAETNLQKFNYTINSSDFPVLGSSKRTSVQSKEIVSISPRAAKRVRSQDNLPELPKHSFIPTIEKSAVEPSTSDSSIVSTVSSEIREVVGEQVKLLDGDSRKYIEPFFKSLLEAVNLNNNVNTAHRKIFETMLSPIFNNSNSNNEDLST